MSLGGNFDWYPVETSQLYKSLKLMEEWIAEHPDCNIETKAIFEKDILRCKTEIERRKTESPEETYKRNRQILDTNGTSF